MLACVLLLACRTASAAPASAETALWLDSARPVVDDPPVLAWFGPPSQASIEAAAGGRLPFQRLEGDRAIPFGSDQVLWMKLRLHGPAPLREAWQLEVPLPVLDRVTVYQREAGGRWVAHTAGDTVPMRAWPRPARYPVFALQLAPGAVSDVYLEVRHSTPNTVPLRVATVEAHHRNDQREYLALGVTMGTMALLLAASMLRAWRLREPLYGWYALHALTAMLSLAAFTGVAAHLFWGDATAWSDGAGGALALLAGTLAAGIVARLGAVRTRMRGIAGWLHMLCVLGLLFAFAYLAIPRGTGVLLLAIHLFSVAALCLWAAASTWRRGDPVGLWLLLAILPMAAAVVLAMARAAGLLPSSWLSEYALVLALALGVPMLFGALDSRSQERRSVELRRLAAANQDALTGLMKREPFLARLHQAIARYQRRGEGAAVAVVEVANYGWIQKTRGAEAAEEALLRTVIKLRRLVRDVDTTGRVGENRFGLILEGVAMRRPMNSVASRLVAAGLMEEPGRPRDVVLHFHVAALVLHEQAGPAVELLQALEGMLGEMSPRTQRPLRFLETPPPGAPRAPDAAAVGEGEPGEPGSIAPA